MKRKPCGTNGVSKIRKIPDRTTKKLGGGYEVDRRSLKEYEEAIQ